MNLALDDSEEMRDEDEKRKRKFEEMACECEKLLDMGAAASRARKKEVITMDQLTWRIAMLREHGSKVRGRWTPRVVAISISSADASVSTQGSVAAPMLPFASTCEFDP